jgi:branched-chain amino acid transport system substrate-binding protein
MMRYWIPSSILGLFFVLCIPSFSSGQGDKEKKPIYLGQSCALTGPARNLGLELRAGLLAAFSEANQAGGIDGREIVLLSIDDGYEPYRAVQNSRRLIERDHVFLLIGAVGTPTSEAVIAITEKKRFPFSPPIPGPNSCAIPSRNTWSISAAVISRRWQRLSPIMSIPCSSPGYPVFTRTTASATPVSAGAQSALQKRGLKLVSTGTYERNTVAVLGGMKDIHKGIRRQS